MHGFSTAGHFADYSVSDYRNAMVLPDGIDMVSAAPLFCAGVTGNSYPRILFRASGTDYADSISCSRPV